MLPAQLLGRVRNVSDVKHVAQKGSQHTCVAFGRDSHSCTYAYCSQAHSRSSHLEFTRPRRSNTHPCAAHTLLAERGDTHRLTLLAESYSSQGFVPNGCKGSVPSVFLAILKQTAVNASSDQGGPTGTLVEPQCEIII